MQTTTMTYPVQANGRDRPAELGGTQQVFRPQQYLGRECETPSHAFSLVAGWAVRYKLLSDGRRQITGVFLPGDICDLGWIGARTITQSVIAVTPVLSIAIDLDQFEDPDPAPEIQQALWNDVMARSEQQTEWTVSLGRKSALERLAHLFCEIFVRLRLAGQTRGDSCDFPLTQLDLADMTGLTPVHVNRTLQEMRGSGLVKLEARRLTLPSFVRLADVGMFNEDYLAPLTRVRCRDLVGFS